MQREELRDGERFDLIVVGAGVGGSILAARIAQFGVNPRNGERLKVALLEWGPYFRGDPRRGYGHPSRRAAWTGEAYEIERYFRMPWGAAMVGGSTQWAGMVAHPPVPIDFQHWQAETGVDWTWEKFNMALAEVREMWHPYPEPEAIRSPGQIRFRDAARAVGYQVYEAGQAKLNCPRCGCCNGRVCRYDAKSTPLVTYIPIAEREGVRIIASTPVEKVIIEKRGARPVATGVVYRRDGKLLTALADKVIVCANEVGTPLLLYRSGYGPREKVRGELLAENRNVGANMVGGMETGYADMWFDEPIGDPNIGVHHVYYVNEPFDAMGYNVLHVFDGLGADTGRRRLPHELALGMLAPEFGREHKGYMKKVLRHRGYLSMNLQKVREVRREITPEGEVVLAGGGDMTRAVLERRHPKILEAILEGREITLKIVKEMRPGRFVVEELPESFGTNHIHGSTRAGASPENSVVNSDFESHDVDNLFICDQGTVPFGCTRNPSMPTAAIASYAWRRIVSKHFSR